MLRPRAAAAPLLALALAAAGCPSSDGSCETSAICDDGELCFEGRCVAALPVGSCTPPTAGTLAVDTSLTSKAVPPACFDYNPSTWPPPATPVLPAGWVLPLTVDGVSDAAPVVAGVGQRVTFSVPPGTSSVTIHQQAVTAAPTFDWAYGGSWYQIPNSAVPSAVQAPGGGILHDDDFVRTLTAAAPNPSLQTSSYLGLTPHTGSLTLPATSRLQDFALAAGDLPAGEWGFRVHDWNAQCSGMPSDCSAYSPSGTYDVTVVARPGPYVSTGTLDVGIYLVGDPAGSAALAVANAGYQRFVWALGQVLGRAGLCLGTVTFFDVPAWAPTMPSVDESPPCGDLARLFSLASPAVDGVHLFLVDDFTPSGYGILGIDGSIPGPSGLPGAVTSGAAMVKASIGWGSCVDGVFDVEACGSDESGYIAAHEIGHWLGLYHTTERTGDQFDPLDETPTCACDACGEEFCDPWGGTLMAPGACVSGSCGGGDNLMFWAYDPATSRGQVTAQQGLVMRANPAVQ